MNKLLYVKGGMGIGGATVMDLLLLKELSSNFNIQILTGKWFRELERPEGIEIFEDRAIDRGVQDPRGYRAKESIEKRLRDFNPDVVMVSQSHLGDNEHLDYALGALLPAIPKLVLRQHDNLSSQNYGLLRPQHGDHIISLSTTPVLADISDRVNPHIPSLVVPNFIDVPDLGKGNNFDLRNYLGLNSGWPIFVQPTGTYPRKNILAAINLVYDLKQQGLDSYLVVTGASHSDGAMEERRKLTQYSIIRGIQDRVFWLGGIPFYDGQGNLSLVGCIGQADLITFMSIYEGFGVPPAEAAALGKQVVTCSYPDKDGNPVFDRVYDGFQFMVDGPPNPIVRAETVNRVKRFCEVGDENGSISHNRNAVQKYTKSEVVPKVVRILG